MLWMGKITHFCTSKKWHLKFWRIIDWNWIEPMENCKFFLVWYSSFGGDSRLNAIKRHFGYSIGEPVGVAHGDDMCYLFRLVFQFFSSFAVFIRMMMNFGNVILFVFIHLFSRCGWTKRHYDEVFNNPDDEQSKISLNIIDRLTKLFTDFAKIGWAQIFIFGSHEFVLEDLDL